MMKNSRFFAAAGAVLALCTLILTGCPPEASKATPDSRLIGIWNNGESGGLAKTFTIDGEYKFTTTINPTYIGAYNKAYGENIASGKEVAEAAGKAAINYLESQGTTDAATRWTVTGSLEIDEGNIYIMKGLEEITGKPAPDAGNGAPQMTADAAVKGVANEKRVEISFTSDTTFTFADAGDNTPASQINQFFGGTYKKVTP
jgi:hypothetical protein